MYCNLFKLNRLVNVCYRFQFKQNVPIISTCKKKADLFVTIMAKVKKCWFIRHNCGERTEMLVYSSQLWRKYRNVGLRCPEIRIPPLDVAPLEFKRKPEKDYFSLLKIIKTKTKYVFNKKQIIFSL